MPARFPRLVLPLLALPFLASGAEAVACRRPAPPVTWKGSLGAAPLQEVRFLPEAFKDPLPVLEAAAPGARVRKGDTLLRLDASRLEEALRDAESSARDAETTLAIVSEEAKAQAIAAEAELAAAEAELQLAQAALTAFREVQAPLRRGGGELAVRKAQAAVDDQQDELAQLEAMYSASELARDTKEIVVKRARRDLELARERLSLARQEQSLLAERTLPDEEAKLASALAQRRAALASARIALKAKADRRQMESGRAREAGAKALELLERLRRDRTQATVVAAADGIVAHADAQALRSGSAELGVLRLEPKTLAQPRTVLMSLLPDRVLTVFGRVPQPRSLRLAPGQEAQVSLTALPGPALKGRIVWVAELPAGRDKEQAPLCEVCVALPGDTAEMRLRAGMEAEIRVAPEPGEVLAVPARAVSREGGRSLCRVRGADGQPAQREVVLGESDGEFVEIRSGLAEGEAVLLP